MKWIISIVVILLLLVGGYFAVAHFSGGAVPTFGLHVGGEQAGLRKEVLKFWEDIKFRDLKSASAFLPSSNQNPEQIANFLTQIFNTPASSLDLVNYDIELIELDSTGLRARVKTKLTANNLSKQEVTTSETMLFFYRTSGGETWYLELGNSF